jgi:hypothetical protein
VRPTRSQPPDAVDALVTDRYLDMLLAAADEWPALHDRDAAEERDVDLPDERLRHAGDVVRAALVRVHPSFRFEDRLAARLADFAQADGPGAIAAGGLRSGHVIPFPGSAMPGRADDPLLEAVADGRLDPADEEAVARAAGFRPPARPLIVGGAITSAALSLVGVAWVAWRAARPGGPAMSRAAREAHARRLADIAELATSVRGGSA